MTELPWPQHLSYSTLNSYMYCSKQMELEKIKKVPQIPAWFLVAGTTFHELTERMDMWSQLADEDPWELWDNEFGKKILEVEADTGIEMESWRAAGITKDRPRGQDKAHWDELGPSLVVMYQNWAHGGMRLAKLNHHEGDSYVPGIEVPITTALPNLEELNLKGYVDRVFEDMIVDYKTGTAKPRSITQLGIYRAGLLAQYGWAPDVGAYYMAREGRLTRPVDLTLWTPEYAGKILAQLHRAVKAEVFLPNPSFSCNSCSVRTACYTAGGTDAAKYDSLHPDYVEGSDE